MENIIKLKDGRDFRIGSFTGEVIDGRSWSDLSIHTTYSVNGKSNVKSKTTKKTQFWLRDLNGKEKSFELSDIEIETRTGHFITVVYGGTSDISGDFLLVVQHTTGQVIDLLDQKHIDDTLKEAGVDSTAGFIKRFVYGALILSVWGIPIALAVWGRDVYKYMGLKKDLMPKFLAKKEALLFDAENTVRSLKERRSSAA